MFGMDLKEMRNKFFLASNIINTHCCDNHSHLFREFVMKVTLKKALRTMEPFFKSYFDFSQFKNAKAIQT